MTIGVPITPFEAWIAGKTGALGDRITRKHISRYQLRCLNEIISWAKSNSPFYREHLSGTGECLKNLEQLADFPFTTPSDISEQGLQLLCMSQSDINRVVTLNTSGTTGNPKRIYFTSADQELTMDFFWCGMSAMVGPGDRTLILLPGERPGSVGDLLLHGLQRHGVEAIPHGFVDSLPETIDVINLKQATCLVGVPVQVLALARHWEKAGGHEWVPRCALLCTDHIPDAIVAELKRIWNCDVYAHYGMTEMGLGGGVECAAHAGYHLQEADLYFEIVDPVTGAPVPDGAYGEVTFTTLTRRGMPLIRYRTGDISRFIPEPCPCGGSIRRLERVRCRKEGKVNLGEDRGLIMADLNEALFALPGIIDFSATIDYSVKPIKLGIGAAVLEGALTPDNLAILNSLRQIPAIRLAEQAGHLVVEVQFINCRDVLPFRPGKRIISVCG